jgi:hypothetical protein
VTAFALPPYPEPPKKPWGNGPDTTYYSNRWPGVTAESVAAFKVEIDKWAAACAEWRKARAALIDAAAKMLTDAGFPQSALLDTGRTKNHRPVRKSVALREQLAEFVPNGGSSIFAYSTPSTHYEERWLAEAVHREREATVTKQADERQSRAVAWLLARGKVIGTDFTVGNAIGVATDIRSEEECEKVVKSGEIMSFDGEDYCEDCPGWRPGNHRCECGNRRVSLTWEGDWESGYARAEAY